MGRRQSRRLADGIDIKNVILELLLQILKKEGPFYPVVEGSVNLYRDGAAEKAGPVLFRAEEAQCSTVRTQGNARRSLEVHG